MHPGFPSHPRPTCRSAPWVLATLTLTLALAGPASADTVGAEGIPDPETVLAAEVPEAPVEVPPELMEPVEEPVGLPPVEPVPAVPEPPPLPEEPPMPEPAEEPVSFSGAVPAPPAEPAEVVSEPPPLADIPEEPEPAPSHADDPEEAAAPVVVPLNLNVDIRILSPGDDGDTSQVIDVGGMPNLGSAPPTDGLDLGLDWTWSWDWKWDCGNRSVAGLEWNWSWSWSGDCAAGLFDDSDFGSMPDIAEHLRGEPPTDLLEAFETEAIDLSSELAEDDVTSGGGGAARGRGGKADETRTFAAPAPSSGGDGSPAPALSSTTFAWTGAPSTQEAATAPVRSPVGAASNGDPERWPAGPPMHAMGLAAAAGGGAGGGPAFTVLLLAALVGALALVPPPPGGRLRAIEKTLSSLLSSSRLERPG